MPLAVSIDFETASTVDLKKAGAHEYARHPDTRVLCLSYAFDNGVRGRWKPGEPFPTDLADHVARGRLVRGWNVAFEWVIWNHVLRLLHPELAELELPQLRDTMAQAAYWGLPMSLDQAAKAMGLPILKDEAGHRLMMQMNKPRRTKAGLSWWHEIDPAKLARLQDYCDRDVLVESTIAGFLPPLPDSEQELWEVDQRINARGVAIDHALVQKLLALADAAGADANLLMDQLTGGQVKTVTATGALTDYLQRELGSPIQNLRKETIEERLSDPSAPDVEAEILDLRLNGAKTSVAKLRSMVAASTLTSRARGMLQYYGASRTGRWAGRLIQLQNMPRGSVKQIALAIEAIMLGIPDGLLRLLYGPLLGVVSSALRGCIVPAPGNELIVADFSQIEARVVAWLAGQQDALDVFARGDDIYVYTAAKIGSRDRQLGKVLVLACGFGMSWRKFLDTARTYKVFLSDKEAEFAVQSWRAANSKIVKFWWACDKAAKDVIRAAQAGSPITVDVGPVKFGMWNGNLLIGLPSGRKLVYRDARIDVDMHGRDGITYMGVDQYTRQWKRLRTYGGKLVENITQAVARDLMAAATMEAERAGLNPELLVHDELIAEAPVAFAQHALDTLLRIMRSAPPWARGLPVWAEGWRGPRYKK